MAKKARKYPSQKRRKKRRRTRRSSKMPKGLLKTAIALAALFSAVFFGQRYYQELHRIAIADTANLETPSQDTQTFIQTIGEDAHYIAAQNDLYASVMIAQAILESNSGQSALSQAPNYNFFGIKGDYNGKSVTMQTWEDDGNGNAYTIDAAFRSYDNPMESLEDYAQFLQKNIYAGVRKSNTNSYQDATAALTGVYATDTSYGAKLNQIIEEYHLTDYDTN